MGNPDNWAETPQEYLGAASLARQVGYASNDPVLRKYLKGKYDPELGLNILFFNNAVKNERKSKLGYHHVFASTLLGPDGRMQAGEQLYQDEERTIPLIVDCDCEEENVMRGQKSASTLARVIRERTLQGIHVTPGRPIYEDQIWVKVMIPGANSQNEYCTMAMIAGDPDYPDTCEISPEFPESAHNIKYPMHWQDYKRRQNKREDGAALFGTPLKELAREGVAILKPSQVAFYEHAGIRTVEQLLSVPDSTAQHLGIGFTNIRRTVQEWTNARSAAAPGILQDEVIKKYEQNQNLLQDELAELRATVRALQMTTDGQAAMAALQAKKDQDEKVKALREDTKKRHRSRGPRATPQQP